MLAPIEEGYEPAVGLAHKRERRRSAINQTVYESVERPPNIHAIRCTVCTNLITTILLPSQIPLSISQSDIKYSPTIAAVHNSTITPFI